MASPLPGRATAEDTLNVNIIGLYTQIFNPYILQSAITGTGSILKATVKAGIEKMVITGSFGAIMDREYFST